MKKLHIETPLIESLPLSTKSAGRVWLKMEALQPSGSFKLRGIGHACQCYRSQGAKHFISSSGGNAGIAVAYSGRQLGIPVTVVVPDSTPRRAVEAIEQQGANVIIRGESWQEAHQYALQMTSPERILIHPFDDPLLWSGHATMIDEVARTNIVPDVIVLSVGGGGLLCGVIEGLHRNSMKAVPVLAVETRGADSLSLSRQNAHLSSLGEITSIATSLGAKQVARHAYDSCSSHEVISHVVSDLDAVDASLYFLANHRVMVEPACGASLSALLKPIDFLADKKNILIIVCGGAGVSIEQLTAWKERLIN
jgi:L-serine/L-threonine ammonia-lyase